MATQPIVRSVAVQNAQGNSENATVQRLWNYHASAAPAVTDDEDDGYQVGMIWVNGATGQQYLCDDATAGAAVWTAQNPSGGVIPADYTPAQTVLVAVADQTPLPVVIGVSEFVGRPAAGNIGAVTAAQARAIIQATTEALFDNLASAGVIDGDRLKANGLDSTNFNAAVADGAILPRKEMVKAFATLGVGNVVATAAQMVNGVITHPAAAAQTLTTDTAVNIIANAGVGTTAGTYFELLVSNTGAGTSTLTGGVGVTIVGDAAVLTGTTAAFLAVVSGAGTMSIFRK